MIDFENEFRKCKIYNNDALIQYLDLVSTDYDGSGYSEIHHILPKSIYPEYKDNNLNMVRLEYSVHVEAHRLLCEILNTYGMRYAYNFMSKKNPDNLKYGEYNPAKFADVREKISKAKLGKSRDDLKGKRFFGADAETISNMATKISERIAGTVIVKDENNRRFRVDVNDERYKNGELVPFNLGCERPNSASKRPDVMNKIMSKRQQTYEKFSKFSKHDIVNFLIEAHNKGKNIFATTKPFSKNYSGYVKRTGFDQHEIKNMVVQRLEKSSLNN